MYQTPIFRELDSYFKENKREFDLEIFFGDDTTIREVFYKEINSKFKPDTPGLLQGFNYTFLKNYNLKSGAGLFSRINFGIISYLYNNKPDILIIHGYDTLTSWFSVIFAKFFNIKIIWRGEVTKNSTTYLKKPIKFLLLKFYFSLCDAFLYSCSGNKLFLKDFNKNISNMFHIPCAVDNNFFKRKFFELREKKIINRKLLNLNEDDFVIMFAARLTNRKRPFDLIKAVASLTNNKFKIIFMGNGPLIEDLKDFAKKLNVHAIFCGWKNQSEIPLYYSIADIAVVLSSYDPSPKAMNEAMNFSLPIITTNVVGTSSDLVRHNFNGFVINVGDVESLSSHIFNLSLDRRILDNMGKRSLEIVSSWNFTKDVEGITSAIDYLVKKKIIE